jgi:uncharacterized membrane protein (DUF2068 family)
MTSKLGLKIERWDTTLLSVFYLISGIAYFLILALSNFNNLVTVFLGFLSLIITYGLIKMKRWTVPFVVAFFFPQITFEVFALYASIATYTFNLTVEVLLFNLALIMHMIFLTLSFLYIAAKRKEFQL